MAKYRKKPVVIEAEVYHEGMEDGFNCYRVITGEFIGYFDKNGAIPKTNRRPVIQALKGNMEVSAGDYIITGIKGERYPCKPDIFEATYDLVEE